MTELGRIEASSRGTVRVQPDRVPRAMNASEWLAAYAEKLGIDAPTTEEFKRCSTWPARPRTPPSASPRRSRAGSPRRPASTPEDALASAREVASDG